MPTPQPKKTRTRIPAHCAHVEGLACAVSGRKAWMAGMVVAAHVRSGTDAGMGRKPSDWWTLPLYWDEHLAQHEIGERPFELRHGIDMKEIAMRTWLASPYYDANLFDARTWLEEHGYQ